MSLFNKFTKGVSEAGNKFTKGVSEAGNKFTKGVSEAGNKAKNTVETSKLKIQISKNTEEINKQYLHIGKEIFNLYREEHIQVPDSVESCIMKIEDLLNQNKNFEKEIKAIWNEKECECGKNIPLEAKFCPSCGYKFPLTEDKVVINEEPNATVILGENTSQTDSPIQTVICSNCDADLELDAKYCGVCGTQI